VESKRSKLGSQIGLFLCLAGLILEWVGWNGAASYDRISEQFPYLLSGGVAGLSLVVIGAALIVVQSQRSERATLEKNLAGLSRVLETLVEVSADIRRPDGGEGFVLAAETAYHRATCGLLEDHPRLRTVSVGSAVEEGLLACRACHPPVPAEPEAADEPETGPAEGAGEWTAGLPGPFPELVDNPWDAGEVDEDEVVVDLRSEQESTTEPGALDVAGDPRVPEDGLTQRP